MAPSTYTNKVMQALPAKLRPNPYSIDEAVMTAIENGWDTDELAKASYINDRNPNPAFVVTNIRNLAVTKPTPVYQRTGWEYGHIKCTDHEGCELCRCVPGQISHHVPAAPSKAAVDGLRKMGRGFA